MRQPGIEPGSRRWQRHIIPLDHWRFIQQLSRSIHIRRESLALQYLFIELAINMYLQYSHNSNSLLTTGIPHQFSLH